MIRSLNPLLLPAGALLLALFLIYTGVSATEKVTWIMEVTPVIIIVPLLLLDGQTLPADSSALRADFLSRHYSDGWRTVHLRQSADWF